MQNIFLCYRREDTAGEAGRICDHLTRRFGQDAVFIDVDSIEPGTDFVDAISEKIGACKVLIVLIGDTWLSSNDPNGRRLDNSNDWVRVEIITARERGIRIIPVLVGAANMPLEAELPEALRFLARLNAIELRHSHFHDDVQHLLDLVGKVAETRPERHRKRVWIAAGFAGVAFLGLLVWLWVDRSRHPVADSGQTAPGLVQRKKSEVITFPPGLPASLDYTDMMGPVRNQGKEGAIVGFAIAAAIEYQIRKALGEIVVISPRYIYYYAREKNGGVKSDSGARLIDSISVVTTRGAVPEDAWPYRPGEFAMLPPPSIANARHYKISKSTPLDNLNAIKSALASYGPVVISVTIYRGFVGEDAAKGGQIQMPEANEKKMAGTALCLVGYDDARHLFKFRNSWGESWGDRGYGYLPYDYVEKFSYDSWAIQL